MIIIIVGYGRIGILQFMYKICQCCENECSPKCPIKAETGLDRCEGTPWLKTRDNKPESSIEMALWLIELERKLRRGSDK